MSQQELRAIVAQMEQMPPLGSLPIAQQREITEQMLAASSIAPVTGFDEAMIGGVPGLWTIPEKHEGNRVMLYLHGGAYVVGSAWGYRSMASQLAAVTRAKVFIVDYRLAPEHPFPAAVDDALIVYRGLLDSGVTAERIVVAGDSAGGGLSMALLLAAREAGLPQPAAAALMSPWVDMTQSGASWSTKKLVDPLLGRLDEGVSMAQAYLNGADPRHPLASPLLADLHDLAPVLIQVGSSECLLDDSTALAARLAAADVKMVLDVWPLMIHVFQGMSDHLTEGREAITAIADFLDSYWPAGMPISR
ncbi:alpha/beta hydrolase [Pseudomonas capeferrum]|uniref:alpha/beta hydrolase n=1 Tax=Pseudomonas capeferrum TaxID=1495066 RepID=UPI0015E364A5|nr:alpha/beta hydrolase [Pseudomonas capeferrum]MBA1200389.1 alpha/beta hydrolase [Pseudomonas capeferrum]